MTSFTLKGAIAPSNTDFAVSLEYLDKDQPKVGKFISGKLKDNQTLSGVWYQK